MLNSEKCLLYKTIKVEYSMESYLLHLPRSLSVFICKLRTTNTKLAIEKGRYNGTPRHERFCDLCGLNLMGDEYHFVMECPILNTLRCKYIPKYYHDKPSMYKLVKLMCVNESKRNNIKFARFVKEGLKLLK